MDLNSLYILLDFAAAAIAAALAIYLVPRWSAPSARALLLLMASVAFWSFSYGLEFKSAGLETKLFWVVLIGVLAPWASNIVYLAGFEPLRHIDLTPVAFTVSGLAFFWGTVRHQMLELIPIARDTVIVRNMLNFARKSDTVLSEHDLASLLDQTIDLAKNDFQLSGQRDFQKIQIERSYLDGMSPVSCDAGQIQQVVFNIPESG